MKILISDPIHEEAINILEKCAEVEIATELSHKELIQKIPEFDSMIVRSATKVRKDVLDAASNLKLIVRAGVGLDNIDLEYAEKLGIKVENTPEASTNAVGELTIGMMIAWARKIPEADKSLKEGKWIKSQLGGTELKGKTLGIAGTGRIGINVSKKGKAFGMNILGFDKVQRDEFKKLDGKYVDKEYLLKNSDYISLHVPLNHSTKHMISKEEFELMKNSAVLVNTARGSVIDEDDLIEALKNEEIAGACLDTYDSRPTENKKLINAKNILLTPHIGASTEEAQRDVGVMAAEKIKEEFKLN